MIDRVDGVRVVESQRIVMKYILVYTASFREVVYTLIPGSSRTGQSGVK